MPSEHLSENEIAAAALADQGGVFNPQQQFRVTWPAEPVVARAYLDQLGRGGGLSEAFAADVAVTLDRSAARIEAGEKDQDLAFGLESLAAELAEQGGDDAAVRRQLGGLAETLGGIAARLR